MIGLLPSHPTLGGTSALPRSANWTALVLGFLTGGVQLAPRSRVLRTCNMYDIMKSIWKPCLGNRQARKIMTNGKKSYSGIISG